MTGRWTAGAEALFFRDAYGTAKVVSPRFRLRPLRSDGFVALSGFLFGLETENYCCTAAQFGTAAKLTPPTPIHDA